MAGQGGHGEPVGEAGGGSVRKLEGLTAGGSEDDLIEGEGIGSSGRDGEVAVVDGIEGATEESYSHTGFRVAREPAGQREPESAEAEYQTGTDTEQTGVGITGGGCADGVAADSREGAVSDFDDAEVDMLMHGVIGAYHDAELGAGNAYRGGGSPGTAGTDKGLSVGFEGELEGRSGHSGADEESVEGCAVSVGDGVADINAGLELAVMVEVVVTADVGAVERARGLARTEEGEESGVWGVVLDFDEGGISNVKAYLSMCCDGRQGKNDDCGE